MFQINWKNLLSFDIVSRLRIRMRLWPCPPLTLQKIYTSHIPKLSLIVSHLSPVQRPRKMFRRTRPRVDGNYKTPAVYGQLLANVCERGRRSALIGPDLDNSETMVEACTSSVSCSPGIYAELSLGSFWGSHRILCLGRLCPPIAPTTTYIHIRSSDFSDNATCV